MNPILSPRSNTYTVSGLPIEVMEVGSAPGLTTNQCLYSCRDLTGFKTFLLACDSSAGHDEDSRKKRAAELAYRELTGGVCW